jgi:hypothetical protein
MKDFTINILSYLKSYKKIKRGNDKINIDASKLTRISLFSSFLAFTECKDKFSSF